MKARQVLQWPGSTEDSLRGDHGLPMRLNSMAVHYIFFFHVTLLTNQLKLFVKYP